MAYVMMNEVRRVGLVGTDSEQATCGSIRLKLLKIGARVVVRACGASRALDGEFLPEPGAVRERLRADEEPRARARLSADSRTHN